MKPSDPVTDPSSPEFLKALYGHLHGAGADKGQEERWKGQYESAMAKAKERKSKKMTDKTAAAKQAAFTQLYARNYVPEFVKQCAARGLVFHDEAELAHALQMNGKFAAMAVNGVNMDTLVNSLVSQLNVKHATDGDLNLDLRTMNAALDATLTSAGVKVASVNSALAAEQTKAAGVSDEELSAFLDLIA